jgi:hypothetical protein
MNTRILAVLLIAVSLPFLAAGQGPAAAPTVEPTPGLAPGNGTFPELNGTLPDCEGDFPFNGTMPAFNGTRPPFNGTRPEFNGTSPSGEARQPKNYVPGQKLS